MIYGPSKNSSCAMIYWAPAKPAQRLPVRTPGVDRADHAAWAYAHAPRWTSVDRRADDSFRPRPAAEPEIAMATLQSFGPMRSPGGRAG